ncbi:hypothetical protein PG984_016503 [Apiospora sp. TS-2023a]
MDPLRSEGLAFLRVTRLLDENACSRLLCLLYYGWFESRRACRKLKEARRAGCGLDFQQPRLERATASAIRAYALEGYLRKPFIQKSSHPVEHATRRVRPRLSASTSFHLESWRFHSIDGQLLQTAPPFPLCRKVFLLHVQQSFPLHTWREKGFPGRYLFVRRPAEASVLQLSPLVVAPASPLLCSNSGYRHSTRLRLRDPPPLYLFHAVIPPSSSPARVLTRVPGVAMVLAVATAASITVVAHRRKRVSPVR